MGYELISDLIDLVQKYEQERKPATPDVHEFGRWFFEQESKNVSMIETNWEGKEKGRSADSVINTSLVHLYRYAKLHAKAAISDSDFSTPDDFIYLLSLTSLGSMSKSALIRLNVHEKSAGMQIVNRLIANGLVEQHSVETNKKRQMISITAKGEELLKGSMQNIKIASDKVTEPLSLKEKMDLIRLLSKMELFHESKLKKNLTVVLD